MALVRHLYGRAITLRYTPLAENEGYVAHSLVSARIYGPNSYPSDEQIEDAGGASTGHIGSRVTTWTLVNEEGVGDAEYKIVFPAVTDPTPTSRTEYDLYYIALNYRAESGGTTIRDVEQIPVYRPDGLTSKIRVDAEAVYRLERRLEEVAPSPLWIEDKIQAAVDELLGRLEGRGYEKRRLFNLEKLNGAAAMLACAYACLDRYTEGDVSWREKADSWREQSDKWFDIAKVGVDFGGGDMPNVEQKAATGAAIWTR